jgi:hypothetical protein
MTMDRAIIDLGRDEFDFGLTLGVALSRLRAKKSFCGSSLRAFDPDLYKHVKPR